MPGGGLQNCLKFQKEHTMDKKVIMIQYHNVFGDRCVFPRLQLKLLSHIVWFPINESKYIKECTKIIGEHNKHENLIAIWDEPIKNVQS
jgi:hypothetical protein